MRSTLSLRTFTLALLAGLAVQKPVIAGSFLVPIVRQTNLCDAPLRARGAQWSLASSLFCASQRSLLGLVLPPLHQPVARLLVAPSSPIAISTWRLSLPPIASIAKSVLSQQSIQPVARAASDVWPCSLSLPACGSSLVKAWLKEPTLVNSDRGVLITKRTPHALLVPLAKQSSKIAAEEQRLEAERIAAEQRRLEEERRVAAELQRQQEEAERERIAAEQQRLEAERLAAEQRRLEEERRVAVDQPLSQERRQLLAERHALAAERNSLEKEKLAFERKQLEQERRALAAERRQFAKQRLALQAQSTPTEAPTDELSAVASVIQDLESDNRRAEEEARLQAERQRLERERQRRIAAERRRLERQRRLEREKLRLAAEQERLEQQRERLAVEQAQLDQQMVSAQPLDSGLAVLPQDVEAKVDSLRNPPLVLQGVPTVRAAYIDAQGNSPYLKQNPFSQPPVGTGDPLSDDVQRILRVKKDLRRLDIALSTVRPQPTTYLARGNVKYSLGDYDGATRDYQRAIDSDPQLADAYINRGASLRKSGRLSEAIASYNKVIAMRPGDPSAYRNRGIAREAQGDISGAISDWRTASRLGDREVLQWIAAASQPQPLAKTVGSLLSQVAPAVTPRPKSNQVLLAEANGLLAKGSAAQARDLYIKILQKDASDRKALFNLAVAFRKAGQYKEALIAYDKYIAVVPDDAQAFRNRGIVKEMQRNLSGACSDWRKAYTLGAQDVKPWLDSQCR